MKNKELKKRLIQENYCQEYSKTRFLLRSNKLFEEAEKKEYYQHNGQPINEEEHKALQQIFKARKEQRKNIRNWLTYWLQQREKQRPINIYFGTFTYKGKKEIKPETLKKYVLRTISDNCLDYVINIDYGSKNDRLHYHALIVIDTNKYNEHILVKRKNKKGEYRQGEKLETPWLLEYEKNVGIYDMEPVRNNAYCANKLSAYLDKLVLHSIKVKQAYIAKKKNSEYQKVLKEEKLLKKVKMGFGMNNYDIAKHELKIEYIQNGIKNNWLISEMLDTKNKEWSKLKEKDQETRYKEQKMELNLIKKRQLFTEIS